MRSTRALVSLGAAVVAAAIALAGCVGAVGLGTSEAAAVAVAVGG